VPRLGIEAAANRNLRLYGVAAPALKIVQQIESEQAR
jgi:hypothetical protein